MLLAVSIGGSNVQQPMTIPTAAFSAQCKDASLGFLQKVPARSKVGAGSWCWDVQLAAWLVTSLHVHGVTTPGWLSLRRICTCVCCRVCKIPCTDAPPSCTCTQVSAHCLVLAVT